MGKIIQNIKRFAKRNGIVVDRYRPHSDKFRVMRSLSEKNNCSVLLDVGANNGGFARDMFEAGFGGTIVSVEPQLEPWQEISAQTADNPRWRQWPRMCLGPENGTVEFSISENSVSSSVLPVLAASTEANAATRYIKTETVAVHRLDDVVLADEQLSDQTVPFALKLDVQGFERQVLDGASASFRRIPVILLEMSLTRLYDGAASFSDLYIHLESLGYSCVGIYPGFTDPVTMRMLQVDGIFENPIRN